MFSSAVSSLQKRVQDDQQGSLLYREQHLEAIVNIAEVQTYPQNGHWVLTIGYFLCHHFIGIRNTDIRE
jgi:hypothetical protein